MNECIIKKIAERNKKKARLCFLLGEFRKLAKDIDADSLKIELDFNDPLSSYAVAIVNIYELLGRCYKILKLCRVSPMTTRNNVGFFMRDAKEVRECFAYLYGDAVNIEIIIEIERKIVKELNDLMRIKDVTLPYKGDTLVKDVTLPYKGDTLVKDVTLEGKKDTIVEEMEF